MSIMITEESKITSDVGVNFKDIISRWKSFQKNKGIMENNSFSCLLMLPAADDDEDGHWMLAKIIFLDHTFKIRVFNTLFSSSPMLPENVNGYNLIAHDKTIEIIMRPDLEMLNIKLKFSTIETLEVVFAKLENLGGTPPSLETPPLSSSSSSD